MVMRSARISLVFLTERGRRRAREITRARTAVLEGALESLTPEEHEQLGELAGKVLAGLVRPPGATRWTCRLCDVAACGRPEGRCPVAQEARRRMAADAPT